MSAGGLPAAAHEAPPRVKRRGKWRRRFLRWGLWVSAGVAAILFFSVITVRSQRAREQLRVYLEAELSARTLRDVSLERVDYSVLPPAMELYGLTIPGPHPGEPPVLTVDRLRFEASLLDLWRRNWRLRQVEALRPRLTLRVQPDGETNLPRFEKPSGGQGLDLGTLLVEEGEFSLNDLKMPVDLAAQEVRARFLGEGPNALQGQLSLQDMRVVLPGAKPVEVDLVANGRLGATGLEVASVAVRTQDFSAEAQGQVTWGAASQEAHPEEPHRVAINLRLKGQGRAEILSRLGYFDGEISGPLSSRGRLTWEGGEWVYRSTLLSPALSWLDLEIGDLEGELLFEDKELTVDIGRGDLSGGRLFGRIHADFKNPDLPIEADVRFVDVSADRFLEDRGLPLRGFASLLDGEVAYRSLRRDRSKGSGWGQVLVRPAPGGGEGDEGMVWEGEIPFTIEEGRVASRAVLLRAPGQRLWAGGEYDIKERSGIFDIEVDTSAAGPLAELLLPYLGEDPNAAWVPREGRGRGQAQLTLESSGAAAVDLRLDLRGVETAELIADRAHGRIRATGAGVEHINLELDRGGGALLVTGAVDRPGVSGERLPADGQDGFLVDLKFDAVGWPLAEIRSWRDLEVPLAGAVSGRLSLMGPGDEISGRFDGRVETARLGEVPVEQVAGRVRWDSSKVYLQSVEARAPAGRISVDGTIDSSQGDLKLSVTSEKLRLDQLPLSQWSQGRLAGHLSLEGTVTGTSDRPEMEMVAKLSRLEILGRSLEPQTPTSIRLGWDGERLTAEGELPGLGTFSGSGNLDRNRVDLSFDVDSEEARGLAELAAGRSIPALEGNLAGRVTLSGAFESPEELLWGVALARFRGRLGELDFEQLEPVQGSWQAGKLRLESVYLGELSTESEVFAQGKVDFAGDDGLDLNLQGTTDIRWLKPFLAELAIPPEVDLRGRFDALGRVLGPLDRPRFDGQGELRLEPFAVPLLPQAVDDFVAQLSFYPDRLELERLVVDIGNGGLAAQGRVDLPASPGAPAEYRFYALARDLKLLIPEGWLQQGSAELWLTSKDGRRELEGSVQLAQVRYLEDLDVGLGQVVTGLLERERQEVGSTQEWLTGTLLNLSVEAPDALRVRNRAASLRGDLDLEIRGSLARPVVLGKVDLQPGGILRYADNEYRLERGLVTFNNPYFSEPILDIVASSRVRSYEVSLGLSGTPERLDLEVSSDPPLPELDVMALVTGGRPLDFGARPTLPGSRDEGRLNAQAFLYGQAATAITERVNTLFGFDKFRVDPLSDGSDTVSSVRVTVGKRLSKDLFVTYSRDPSTTEQDILEAEWQINSQLVLVFTQNGDGTFSVDALWDRRF